MEKKKIIKSSYSTSIVQGWSKLRINAYFDDSDLASFEFTFNNEPIPDGFADDFASLNSFAFDMSDFDWTRESVSSALRSIFYYDFTLLEPQLGAWEETIYYHCARVFERLRHANSSHGLRLGVLFLLHFELKLPRRAGSIGFDNLLRRVERNGDKDSGACAVCLDKFEETGAEELTCFPCSHAFHFRCLARWLPKSRTCPLCRREMVWRTVDKLP